MTRSRRPLLSVDNLESREVPATFSYSAGTLTVTATSANEDFTVAPATAAPAGYIVVEDGQDGYSSVTNGEPVKNIVFNLAGANTASVTTDADLALGGSMTIVGAKNQTVFLNAGDIGKNLTITGGAGTENLIFDEDGSIGGNVTISMGGGAGQVQLQGGKIYGSLSVLGGTGKDEIKLTQTGDMEIGGSASFKLGLGADEVVSAGNGVFRVNGDLFIAGGAENDKIDLENATDTVLDVGGDLTMKMGKGANEITTTGVDVGGDLLVAGGADGDSVGMGNFTQVGGAALFTMGDGVNSVGMFAVTIGNNLSYTGGINKDTFEVDAFTIGKNIVVSTSDVDSGGIEDVVGLGANDFIPCRVFGSVSVTGGVGNSETAIARTDIGGKLTIATGADTDLVLVDDTNVTGATSIKTGGGIDTVWFDNQDNDDGGNLGGAITTFGGAVSVSTGGGDDFVNLAATGGNQIRFGSTAVFLGGSGNDTLDNTVVNEWFGPDGSEDFEAGNNIALA